MAGEIRIGTSGWHYKHWLGTFYPEGLRAPQMFKFYQGIFDTVELNNSFYRLPTTDAFAAWRDSAPANFIFAVKGSRFLTHNKELKEPQQALDNLLPRAEILGDKLGPILFQLPPKWKVNAARLEEFLRALPKQHRYTFEFREPTWHTLAVYRILERYNAAYCIHELAGFHTPVLVTADFAYVRLHGPGARYQGSYSDDKLSEWAERISKWKRELKAVYVYFDNDEAGYAPRNALKLKRLISKRSGSSNVEQGLAD